LKKEALKKSQGQKKPEELIRYLGDYFIWAEIIKDKNTVLAQAFLDYLLSDKAKPIWKKHGYELK